MSSPVSLKTPVSDIPMVGPVYVTRLKNLEIETVEDLLHHYPFRYEDYSYVSDIRTVQAGEKVTIQGNVVDTKNDYTKSRKSRQTATIEDNTGKITITWFNQPYITKSIKVGDRLSASGEAKFFGKSITMVAPEYEVMYGGKTVHTARIVPIYPETAGVTSKWLRRKVTWILSRIGSDLADYLPEKITNKYNLLELKEAVYKIHFPESLQDVEKARERLGFDELVITQLVSSIRKRDWKKEKTTHSISVSKHKAKLESFVDSLPFTLTSAQNRSIQEILSDIAKQTPMNRLLQGDVGSGKTIVAATAIYASFLNKYQSALMAPTEILAQQHYESIRALLEPLNVIVALATSSQKINMDKAWDVIIGTHALIYQQEMDNLAFVVIDEQHRFGVSQRGKLKSLGAHPHLLSMTATPIPRSIALIIHSELDVSVLDEMPKGRLPIKTWLVPNEKRKKAYEWIKQELDSRKHNQAFIICPLVDVSEHETLQAVKAATEEFESIKNIFKQHRVGLVHGKLKSKQKKQMLDDFASEKLDILVATPVVEVGIDIPNASIIVIEAAERFGLAQLHQLRGRVGRSDMQSYCLLFTESENHKALSRLKRMEKTQNGADLAELDLSLRGPGDIYGTRQSGFSSFKIASFTDKELIHKSQQATKDILRLEPKLGSGSTDESFLLLQDKLETYIIGQVNPD